MLVVVEAVVTLLEGGVGDRVGGGNDGGGASDGEGGNGGGDNLTCY